MEKNTPGCGTIVTRLRAGDSFGWPRVSKDDVGSGRLQASAAWLGLCGCWLSQVINWKHFRSFEQRGSDPRLPVGQILKYERVKDGPRGQPAITMPIAPRVTRICLRIFLLYWTVTWPGQKPSLDFRCPA